MRAATLGQHRLSFQRPWLGVLLSLGVILGIPWALAWHAGVHAAHEAAEHAALAGQWHSCAARPETSVHRADAGVVDRGTSEGEGEHRERPGHPCTTCLDLLFATIAQVAPDVAPLVGVELLIAVDAHAPTRRLTAQDRRLVAAPRGPPRLAA